MHSRVHSKSKKCALENRCKVLNVNKVYKQRLLFEGMGYLILVMACGDNRAPNRTHVSRKLFSKFVRNRFGEIPACFEPHHAVRFPQRPTLAPIPAT